MRSRSTPTKSMSSSAQTSRWAAGLPHDILWTVFLRLVQRDVLRGAGLTCAEWWHLARYEPDLWRRVDLTEPGCGLSGGDDDDDDDDCTIGEWIFDEAAAAAPVPAVQDAGDEKGWKAMALAAVDRGTGRCEAFWGRADNGVLVYLADRAPHLRSLHVTLPDELSLQVLTDLMEKFRLLEDLVVVLKSDASNATPWREKISPNPCRTRLFHASRKACNHLKRFTVRRADNKACEGSYRYHTKDVLLIVDGIHKVQSLDIRLVPDHNDRWEVKMRARRPRIVIVVDEDFTSDEEMTAGPFW
ncbi:hypothetical protein ACP4OV_019213 [Aristida adscensionis]